MTLQRKTAMALAFAALVLGGTAWKAAALLQGALGQKANVPQVATTGVFTRANPSSTQADEGYGPLNVKVTSLIGRAIIFFKGDKNSQDVGRLFPEWQPVNQPKPALIQVTDHRTNPPTQTFQLKVGRSYEELEGVIPPVGGIAHVTFEDFPLTHYSHDMCFKVKPDPAYQYLLGNQGSEGIQKLIEVEWESGLAQNNDGNPASEPNKRGDSFGFFSTGHRRGDMLWNWPTVGDHVHVDGLWIWDRGHPPAETEIHPPRLLAVERHLPAVLQPPAAPTHYMVATRADVFATGDSNAIWNNRPGQPFFVQRVPMSEKDYVFNISQSLPRPAAGPPVLTPRTGSSGGVQLASFGQVTPGRPGIVGGIGGKAQLKWRIDRQPGDTFPGEPTIQPFPDGTPDHPTPYVRVTIPWKTARVPDTATFARTIYVFWDNDSAHGVASDYKLKAYRVTLDKFQVKNPQDGDRILRSKEPGEWRVFVEVGGQWYFLNDLVQPKPLEGGLDDAHEDQEFAINRSFVVYVAPTDTFRVHTDGWDCDGIDNVMGHLINQYDQDVARIQKELNDRLFTLTMYTHGSRDDPIGEINSIFNGSNGGVGSHQDWAIGDPQTNDPSGDTFPDRDYYLYYRTQAIPLP